MPIIINSTTLGSSASINGTSLNTIKFNGTTVWEAIVPEIYVGLNPQIGISATEGQRKVWPNSGYNNLFGYLSQPVDVSKYRYFQIRYQYGIKGGSFPSTIRVLLQDVGGLLNVSRNVRSQETISGYTAKQEIPASGTCPTSADVYASWDGGIAWLTIYGIKFTNE